MVRYALSFAARRNSLSRTRVAHSPAQPRCRAFLPSALQAVQRQAIPHRSRAKLTDALDQVVLLRRAVRVNASTTSKPAVAMSASDVSGVDSTLECAVAVSGSARR
jgi:hypothetical protein